MHLKRCILGIETSLRGEQTQQGERVNCLQAEGNGAIKFGDLKYTSDLIRQFGNLLVCLAPWVYGHPFAVADHNPHHSIRRSKGDARAMAR